MDVYQVLKEDHRTVEKLLAQLSETSERAIKTREQLFMKLKDALLAHAKAEEKIFYSSINQEDVRELVTEAKSEHKQVEKMLKEMEKMDVSNPEWINKLQELKQSVEHHVKEEESEIFKQAHRLLSNDEADSMGEEVEQEEEKMLKH